MSDFLNAFAKQPIALASRQVTADVACSGCQNIPMVTKTIKSGRFRGEVETNYGETDTLSNEILRADKSCALIIDVSHHSQEGVADGVSVDDWSVKTTLELAKNFHHDLDHPGNSIKTPITESRC